MQPSPEFSHCTPAEEHVSSRDNFNDEASGFGVAFGEIQQIQKTQDHLKKSLEILKINHQRDYMVIIEALEEGKLRYDGLKRELADLTELHEGEIWNLKEELISTKDKMDYTYYEREEFHEAMEACHSRLLNVELQQQQQLQHNVYMERDEDTIPRRVLGKIISMFLAVLTSILVFVSMTSQYVILLKPSGRMLSVLFLGAVLYVIWKYMEVAFKYKVSPAFATP